MFASFFGGGDMKAGEELKYTSENGRIILKNL
jgi:hypothetical protein